jgi:uncharacterized protein (TIGR02246 family)
MKSQTMIIAALAAGFVMSGCAAKKQEEAPAVDIAAEQQAIRDRSAEWMKLAQAKDSAAIATGIFATDAITAYDGNVRKGAAEIQAALEAESAASPNAVVTWTTDNVRVAASGDLALETGNLTADSDGPGEKPATTGYFATTWAKVDGQWRVVADAGTDNSTPSAAEPAAPAN